MRACVWRACVQVHTAIDIQCMLLTMLLLCKYIFVLLVDSYAGFTVTLRIRAGCILRLRARAYAMPNARTMTPVSNCITNDGVENAGSRFFIGVPSQVHICIYPVICIFRVKNAF